MTRPGAPATDQWEDEAACGRVDPKLWELWFAGDGTEPATRAKRICADCPVRRACLTAALTEERGEPKRNRHGIRGGLSPYERVRLERQQCARRTSSATATTGTDQKVLEVTRR